MPNDLTSIEYMAFYRCTSLESIIIPNGVTKIDEHAFSGCSSLSSVSVLANTPPSANSNVFTSIDLSNVSLFVPVGSKYLYSTVAPWKDFGSIAEIDPEAITAVKPDTQKHTITYTIDGLPVDPQNATVGTITIQRYPDGSTRKMIFY